jgi:hypothetical protein
MPTFAPTAQVPTTAEAPAPSVVQSPIPAIETFPTAATGPSEHFSLSEESPSAIPNFSLDQPLPTSALDGYVLDDNEVLDAIVHVDTGSIEQEAQVLEAVEVLSTPAPLPTPETTAPPAAQPQSDPGQSTIKHGFF